ncbi:MAG: flagellar protein FlgN [Marinobacter sp.]|uniref:flagella synthesis protein FlgN n=1 Tax=Marinobacter sp. TaxID=50741 RepID=UPI00299DAE51|nr:flagellar protein FlgN [Marinobacter sp.]MDX1755583.1 flagellar protein FlgN [Marinobacter sp.]
MAAIDKLKQLLEEDSRQLDKLASLLKEEKASLSKSDVKALEPITQQKDALLKKLRERAKQKIHLLVEMGYRPDSGNPSRFIQSSGMTELIAPWTEAERRLKACQSLNAVNSRVVGHLQKRLARLSDIFRGTTGQQKLYGATGHQTSVNQRTILASA